MNRGLIALLAGLALVFGGAWWAARVQTSGGITVSDVRFPGEDGVAMSGLLYVPKTATPMKPAPGILAVHGYLNSRETQDGFAIEFARRGYVVLAMDQTGHGYSGGAATSAGFGGPAGLRYLRSLPMVDRANIGLEGHSMGGWAVLAAAAALPDAYRSMVLEGSTTGKPFAPEGTPTWPRNLAVVESRYDEFSKFMWGVDRAQDVARSAKLKALFGSSSDIRAGRLYGTLTDGTARRLATPLTTHPGDHVSTEAIGESLDWFAITLKPVTPLPLSDQIWPGKEIGTGVALVGALVLMLGVFDLLLGVQTFAALRQTPVAASDRRDGAWWRWFLLTAAIPILTYFPAFAAVKLWLKPSWGLPQPITNQVIVWALVNTAITLLLPLGGSVPPSNRMARPDPGRTALIAALTVGSGYVALRVVDALFKVDFRFWVLALKLPSGAQTGVMLHYLPAFLIFFAVTLNALHKRVTVKGEGVIFQYGMAKLALAGGFLVLLAVDYVAYFLTGNLPTAFDPLSTIVALQFLPLMAVVAIISVFTWRRTNSYLPGALICTLLVTWYVVAGTATHVV